MQAAARKQKSADAAIKQQLESIRALLSAPGGQQQRAQQLQQQHQQHAAMAAAVPLAAAAVVRAGALPFCLRSLLQNDSLQDISARRELYMAALQLLRCAALGLRGRPSALG
jgi:hypothetical protein